MTKLDEIRAEKLVQLARDRFDPDLSEAELKVLRDSAGSLLPEDPEDGAARPAIRPGLVRWLATDTEASANIDPGGLRILGATILGPLNLRGARVAVIISCFRCTFSGEIDLRSAETRGILFTECTAPQTGIRGDRLLTHGPLLFRRCQFGGQIRMLGVHIEGNLDGSGAELTSGGISLALDRAEIAGNVVLASDHAGAGDGPDRTDRFLSSGTIRLNNARIAGQLMCSGAKLAGDGRALVLDGAEIQGSVYLDKGLDAAGAISLAGSKIAGDLAFSGARIATVYCANMDLLRDLIWQGIEKSDQTRLFLGGARMRNLRDDRASWPNKGEVDLDGLTYEELTLHEPPTSEEVRNSAYGSELPLVAEERIEWLMLQPRDQQSEPQPWMFLFKHLVAKGDRKGANHVLYIFRRLEARKSWLLWRWYRYLFAWLEEAPQRIGWFIGLTLLLFTCIFWHAGAKGALAPTEKDAYEAFVSGKRMPAVYPTLNPFIYTLENALPLVRLGQDDKWAPDPRFPSKNFSTNYWFLMWTRWVLVIWGWFQAGILGAAIVERFKPK